MTGPSYESLYKWQNSVMKELRNNRGLADITSDYSKNKPEVQLVIDENKAKDLGSFYSSNWKIYRNFILRKKCNNIK